MRRRERNAYIVISVAVAVAMWYFVGAAQNPEVERWLAAELRVRGLSADLVVVQAPERVEVRVRGPRSAVAALTPVGIAASVNLADVALQPGEYRVPVRVEVPPGIQIGAVRPEQALVVVDTVVGRELPVEVVMRGSPPVGVIPGQPVAQPARVFVQGPRSLVQQSERAVVVIDVSVVRNTVIENLRVRVLDAGGAEVGGLSVRPQTVQVTLPVSEGLLTRTLPVVPTITGQPQAGLSLALVQAEPAVVTVVGPQEVVVGLTSATTEPVDISRVDGEVRRMVDLVLPDGVRAEGLRAVTVRLAVLPAPVSRLLESVPLRIEGLAAGLEAVPESPTVRVTVVGPKEAVERLDAGQIAAVADLSGRSGERVRVPVRVRLPEGILLARVEPAEVAVRLRRR
ncbi:MAG: CdaR family protein [Armatimonadota bacterium]|nr:CdaR family protein [Armatimonadota bacterium]MDR5697990.1 CdaR family protein [Armatimonadota bacterium]